jgi:hypothetical protein
MDGTLVPEELFHPPYNQLLNSRQKCLLSKILQYDVENTNDMSNKDLSIVMHCHQKTIHKDLEFLQKEGLLFIDHANNKRYLKVPSHLFSPTRKAVKNGEHKNIPFYK